MAHPVNFERVKALPAIAQIDTIYFVLPEGATNGEQYVTGHDGIPVRIGAIARSIASTRINAAGFLIVTYTDGTTENAGYVGNGLPLLIVGVAPTAATVGSNATFKPTIIGGTPPYALSIVSGALPPGRAISGLTIAGTYTTPGIYSYILLVTDALGATAILPVGPVVVTSTYVPALKFNVPANSMYLGAIL